jgi:cysteinyl-tRNA synthetase
MALALIGERFGVRTLDIHAGGVDLIFPHHEDEIAQSCAFTGEAEFARYWVHGEFLNIQGSKMSKRFGNITTARDLREDGVPPQAFRLLSCSTHYRQTLDLTDEALAAAREGSRRLGEFGARLLEAGRTGGAESPGFAEAADRLEAAFGAALDEDLNAPQGLAALFDFAREGNRLLDAREAPGGRAAAAWTLAEGVLGVATPAARRREIRLTGAIRASELLSAELVIGPAASSQNSEVEPVPSNTPPGDTADALAWAEAWAGRRLVAKGRRDYAEADRIRVLLGAAGFEVRDRKDGAVEVVHRGS